VKNIGPFLAFDKNWFEKHQRPLLKLANTSKYFRWQMGIQDCDYDKSLRIAKIAPNHVTYVDPIYSKLRKLPEQIVLKTDFRTHPKYSKRVYNSLKPVWWAMHAWDKPIDVLAPKLSFGFDTLTSYPDPDPGTTTCDGYARRFDTETIWSDVVTGAGNGAGNNTDPQSVCEINSAFGATDMWTDNWRSFFLFDTSALTSGATISAAVLSIFGNSKQDQLAITPNVDVYTSTPASNTAIVSSDYSNVGSTSQTGAPISYASWSTSAYNDFTFSATGRGNVSKTGISKFATRNANYDVANSAPTWSTNKNSRLRGNTADQTGTSQDPKLVVTYTVSTAFPRLSLLGVGR
jgi:hypothetical protein